MARARCGVQFRFGEEIRQVWVVSDFQLGLRLAALFSTLLARLLPLSQIYTERERVEEEVEIKLFGAQLSLIEEINQVQPFHFESFMNQVSHSFHSRRVVVIVIETQYRSMSQSTQTSLIDDLQVWVKDAKVYFCV